MKILRVMATMNPRYGGPSEGVRQVTQALSADGHTTEVACLDSPGSPWITEGPCVVHPLGPPLGRYNYSRRLAPWLKQNAARFDCTIVHGVWQYTSLITRRVSRRLQRPYFLYPHGMLDPWFQRAYPLKHLKKMAYWRLAEYRVLRDARAVLFTSEVERDQAEKAFRPYHCNAVTVNYGTSGPPGDSETQRRAFLERFPELAGKRFLLFLSRIHQKKGCDLLVDAFAEAARRDPELHLVIAGPDQVGWVAVLRRQTESLGVADRVHWPGMLSGDLKWGAFRTAEAFCLPSHQENFGIAVAEALACGLPVLISDRVNIWREIEQDGAGIVATDDRQGTIDGLRRWQLLESEQREEMGRRALACFTHRFHIQEAARSLVRTLRENGVEGLP